MKQVDGFIYRLAWALLVGITTFVGKQLYDINAEVRALNINMTVALEILKRHDKTLEAYDARLLVIENHKGG